MAGIVEYMAPIKNASGKIFGKKQRFVSVSRSFGNKQRGCMAQGTRNYVSHPLTQGEISQRAKFSTGAALRKMILEDPTLSAQWMARFKNDSGTKCSTFNGYVMSNAMKGHVSEDGSWQA